MGCLQGWGDGAVLQFESSCYRTCRREEELTRHSAPGGDAGPLHSCQALVPFRDVWELGVHPMLSGWKESPRPWLSLAPCRCPQVVDAAAESANLHLLEKKSQCEYCIELPDKIFWIAKSGNQNPPEGHTAQLQVTCRGLHGNLNPGRVEIVCICSLTRNTTPMM